jgi:hypothetical protein
MKAAASELGFTYRLDGRGLWKEEFARLPLFHRGFWFTRSFRNVLRGRSEDFEVVVADYAYFDFWGWDISHARTTAAQFEATVIVFQLAKPSLPDFSAEARTWPPQISGPQAQAVAAVLDKQLLHRLYIEQWNVVGGGAWVALYKKDPAELRSMSSASPGMLSPADALRFRGFLRSATDIFRLFAAKA